MRSKPGLPSCGVHTWDCHSILSLNVSVRVRQNSACKGLDECLGESKDSKILFIIANSVSRKGFFKKLV